jgi:hypothetical protein
MISFANGRNVINFEMFFKRHIRLPVNRAIRLPQSVGKRFRGDILIMRVGNDGEGVVNMRAHDGVIADWVVRRYVVMYPSVANAHLILGQLHALQLYVLPIAFQSTSLCKLVLLS